MALGRKTGGGSRKGKKNRANAAREAAIAASGLTPLEYLLGVMRDTELERAMRVDAAKAAAPYVHPRMNAVEFHGDVDVVANVTRTIVDPRAS